MWREAFWRVWHVVFSVFDDDTAEVGSPKKLSQHELVTGVVARKENDFHAAVPVSLSLSNPALSRVSIAGRISSKLTPSRSATVNIGVRPSE